MTNHDSQEILRRAERFTYSGMTYADPDELAQYNILRDDAHAMILLGRRHGEHNLHWAANSVESLLEAAADLRPLRLAFVPEAWLTALQAAEFVVTAEFVDFFNREPQGWCFEGIDENTLRFLPAEQAQSAHEVSMACRLQSRGFEGEPASFFVQWEAEQENGRTLATYEDGTLVGYCCVGTYAPPDQRVLWLREVAVHPRFQGKGYGRRLVQQALSYGHIHRCVKAFLAADVLNLNAIALYRSLGFVPRQGRGEINLRRD